MECCPYERNYAQGGYEWLKPDGSRPDGSRPQMDCGRRWMIRDGSRPAMDRCRIWMANGYGWMTGGG